MRNNSLLLWVLLFVDGVFVAVADELTTVSVSVMEGDSVTLNTGISKLNSDDGIDWMLGDDLIARINEADGILYDGPDGRFRDRLKLDKQTGSLTIMNITVGDSEKYKLVIKRENEKFKTFRVTVNDEMKIVLVKKEESIILRTGATDILGYDLILWKFEEHLLAKINRTATQFSIYDNADGRFKGRLQLHHQTGSLIISDTRTTDSGDYQLNMNSISHSLQRTYSVTVKGLSSAVIAVICVSLALVVAAVLAIYWWFKSRQSRDVV